MSDDLVKRMRSIHNAADCDQAADRIEALTAEREANGRDYCALMERYDALQVENARLRGALHAIQTYDQGYAPELRAIARAALTGKEVNYE